MRFSVLATTLFAGAVLAKESTVYETKEVTSMFIPILEATGASLTQNQSPAVLQA